MEPEIQASVDRGIKDLNEKMNRLIYRQKEMLELVEEQNQILAKLLERMYKQ